MKIYPGKTNIITSQSIDKNTDIPLAYIDEETTNKYYNVKIDKDLSFENKKMILPYDEFDNLDFIMFNDKGQPIEKNEMIKFFSLYNNKYIYTPKNSLSFVPKKYIYNVTIKRKYNYRYNKIYNLDVLYLDEELLNYNIFNSGDFENEKEIPNNIIVNDNKRNDSVFFEGNIKNKDFVFKILSNLNCDKEGHPFDVNNILEHKVNTFLFYEDSFLEKQNSNEKTKFTLEEINEKIEIAQKNISNFEDIDDNLKKIEELEFQKTLMKISVNENIKMKKNEKEQEYKIKNCLIFKKAIFKSSYIFNVPENTNEIKYYNLFDSELTPILIEERIGQGFIIHASKEFLNSIFNSKFYEIFYEILMFVLFQRYVQSDNIENWITDIVPDIIVDNNNVIKKNSFSSNMEYYKMFNESKEDIVLFDVKLKSSPFTKYKGLEKDFLIFEKDPDYDNGRFSDPKKEQNLTSIYTSNKDIMFLQQFHYLCFNDLSNYIKIEIEDDYLNIYIQPYKSSSHNIYIDKTYFIKKSLFWYDNYGKKNRIKIPHFYLVQEKGKNTIDCVLSENYIKDKYSYLGEIDIKTNSKQNLYDVRQRGGGLSVSENDIYDCFDIGNINGRPYRKGGTGIIKMPKKLQQYNKIIEDTINQYKVAEDLFYILYNNKEENNE